MRKASRLASFAAACALSAVFVTAVHSHDEPGARAHHIDVPMNPTAVMKAFSRGKLGDEMGVQNLNAAGSAPCSDGLAGGVYPCSNVDLEAFMPLADIGQTQSNDEANDIWGWTDPVTGNEYAIIGRVFGTSFVDITNPEAPVYLGQLSTHGRFGSPWRDIKVYNDHAFIVSEARRHGMQVFDLTQLGSVVNPPVEFQETAHYRGFGSAHNIVINEETGFAYGVGTDQCSGGLEMVDISNPTNPTDAGCFSADGYTHDAQCVIYDGPDTDHTGKEICLASNEDTLTIVDVTNKSSPVQLSRTSYTGSHYTHQGWLTEDHSYFLLDDELDEQDEGHNTRTRIFNVTDLDIPTFVNSYDSSFPAIDHNQYIKGDYSYQANYRAGLRILDISDAANGNLSEVAYFDIYPEDDAAEFNAAWSIYPYFDSGIVIVSGIEQGLFILRPTLDGGGGGPVVTNLMPASGTEVSGTVSISADATATGENFVTRVDFFIDGSIIGADTEEPYSIIWDSNSVSDGEYMLTATAIDSGGDTSSTSHNIIVDNLQNPALYVGGLAGFSTPGDRGGKWTATAAITAVEGPGTPVSGATVSGSWSSGASGNGTCVTDESGECFIVQDNIKRNSSSVTFTVTGITAAGFEYDAELNQGTTVTITSP